MSLINTYTPDVPQGTQQINNTQQPINYNFQDISDLMSVNHVGFNTSNTFGTHNLVDYLIQSSDPSTGANEMALYSKAANTSQGYELFYRYPNNGTIVQLTGDSNPSSNTTGSQGGQWGNSSIGYGYGYQYLANGILMKWGFTQYYPSGSGTRTSTFSFDSYGQFNAAAQGFPSFTNTPYIMLFCPDYPFGTQGQVVGYGPIYVTPINNTEFTITYIGQPYSGGGFYSQSILWTAIGI